MMGGSQPSESTNTYQECTENWSHWTTQRVNGDRSRCEEADDRAYRCRISCVGRNPSQTSTKPSCNTTARQASRKTAHKNATMSDGCTYGGAEKSADSYGRYEKREQPGTFHGLRAERPTTGAARPP